MDISYLGHSCFKLKGKNSSVITDPFEKEVGFSLPRLSADVVTVSHDHFDHNNWKGVTGTARRTNPFVIDTPGEYEVLGVSVFGVKTYHDDKKGEERGENVVYSILIDGVSVVHLGDLGHKLSESAVSDLNGVDVLLCPVGGTYTINPKEAVEIISAIEPSIVVPMHYKSDKHDQEKFGQLSSVEEFLAELGKEAQKSDRLSVNKTSLPEEMEVVVLTTS